MPASIPEAAKVLSIDCPECDTVAGEYCTEDGKVCAIRLIASQLEDYKRTLKGRKMLLESTPISAPNQDIYDRVKEKMTGEVVPVMNIEADIDLC